MYWALNAFRVRLVALRNGRYGSGRTLNGHALHVMFYTAGAAHFLTATGTSRAAMHQHRQRRTMPGAFFGTIAVQYQNAAVMCSGTYYKICSDLIIGCNDRTTQGTF